MHKHAFLQLTEQVAFCFLLSYSKLIVCCSVVVCISYKFLSYCHLELFILIAPVVFLSIALAFLSYNFFSFGFLLRTFSWKY